jgi:hypothetical protein
MMQLISCQWLAFLGVATATAPSGSHGNGNYLRTEDDGKVSEQDALKYTKSWRPNDDHIQEGILKNNADFAVKTRDLPYSSQVPKSMFLEYVLPYRHFDEPLDDWRPKMYKTLLPFVKDKATLQEAAEALFPAWGNAFGKQLKFKGDQTPQIMAPLSQTLEKGFASCTGMSIFLVNCMRSVGIPARIVGVNEWNRPEKGNHNWVEIWVGDHWNFVDAVPTGDLVTWNKTWFVEQAAKQTSTPAKYAIMSPLWGPEAHSAYNMSWRTPSTFVPAIDVTTNYANLRQSSSVLLSWPIHLIILVVVGVTLGGAGCAYKISKDAKDRQ